MYFDATPASQNPSIVLYTLGRFDVVIDSVPLHFAGRAPQRLLELLGALVCLGDRGVSCGAVADLLWPEADGFDANRALTTALHRLRRLLRCHDAIRLSAGRLTLNPRRCTVDAWRFEQALRVARDPDALLDALDLYRGPFLGDDPNPWAIATRARLANLAADARRMLTEVEAPAQRWRLLLGQSMAFAE